MFLDYLDISFGIVLVVVIAMISFVRLVAHLALTKKRLKLK
jgi:hypothetical protein